MPLRARSHSTVSSSKEKRSRYISLAYAAAGQVAAQAVSTINLVPGEVCAWQVAGQCSVSSLVNGGAGAVQAAGRDLMIVMQQR